MIRVTDDGYPWQPNDGLMVTTKGNYGSTVHDSITGGVSLFLVLCDDCAKAKAKTHIMALTTHRDVVAASPGFKHPSIAGREPLQREAVEWNPEVDYEEAALEVEPEEVGTKMGSIEWRFTTEEWNA
jgi:hypothetical protein